MNIVFYPIGRQKSKSVPNPYCNNFKDALKKNGMVICNEDMNTLPPLVNAYMHVFKGDVFLFNWIESIVANRFGNIQGMLALLLFLLIKIQNKKIVWIFHNIVPHGKDNFISRTVRKYLLHHSNMIITHSQEAKEYLESNTKVPVLFFNHPMPTFAQPPVMNISKKYDVLIWGSILPYKGIVEFLSFLKESNKLEHYIIKIIGRCNDALLDQKISAFASSNIIYENRKVPFDELATLIQQSKYVLFPYVGNSVSSSGALVDTLYMFGTSIGPNVGAFKDFATDGVSLTYETYNDLLSILDNNITIQNDVISQFIADNTWEKFGEKIHPYIEQLQ